MGVLNKILPKPLKPISRDIGFLIRSIFYRIRNLNKNTNSSPIFILGNQKSGTSAIAAILGKNTNKKTTIDLFYSGFYSSLFTKWKNNNISTSDFIRKNAVEFSADIIKEPHLSVFYKELKERFPESKFVMIVRNPLDNIRSILDRLNVEGNKESLSKKDKKKFYHSWSLLLNNSWISGSQEQYIDVLAERWNIISSIYLENKENIILVKYEDFLLDKTGIIKQLSDKLNLTQEIDISHLLDKQFQPKGKKQSVDLKVFFEKANYSRIKEICKKNMQKLGY